MDGEVVSGLAGIDHRRGPATLGLVVAHTRGDGVTGHRAETMQTMKEMEKMSVPDE